ncbi:MAG: phage tail protein [Acetivibrionales bacterium]|jgi:phage tail-like protein
MIEGTVKYFSMNKSDDWENGYLYNLTADNECLKIRVPEKADEESITRGVLYCCALDGRENGMQWRRITMDAEILRDTFIKVSFYASDSSTILIGQDEEKIDNVIKSASLSFKEKQEYLDYLFKETVINAPDALIKSKGRYLWLKIELIGTYYLKPALKRIRIYLPGEDIIDYLPEIYRQNIAKDDFFYRFLSIFQSFIFDMENEIYNISRHFDLQTARSDFIEWLCSWLDIYDVSSWDEKQLRVLLAEAVDIYASAGTKKGIERLIYLYTGEKPIIIEYSQVRPMIESSMPDNPYKKMFGENPYRFFVLINEECISDKKRHEALLRLVSENIPAQTEAVIIPLKPYIYLDMHAYLGINSCIGEQTALKLEKNKSIPFDTIIYDYTNKEG